MHPHKCYDCSDLIKKNCKSEACILEQDDVVYEQCSQATEQICGRESELGESRLAVG